MAKANRRRIVLPEATDARIIQAARRVQDNGICDVTLLCQKEEIDLVHEQAKKCNIDLKGLDLFAVTDHPRYTELSAKFAERRKGKKPVDSTIPLVFGNLLLGAGDAHGFVAGAAHSTADVLRAVLQTVGLAPGCTTLSSFFLMAHENQGAYVFSDCAVNIDPTAEQLADIAVSATESHTALFPEVPPRVAMLSFSTKGSAAHPLADKVIKATELARQRLPNVPVDGELQLDAAIIDKVQASKAPGSPLNGPANVLIFPGLEAGNLGYKLTQRLGGFKAIGPLVQGSAKPANDLSRGCSVADVEDTVLLTCMQALKA